MGIRIGDVAPNFKAEAYHQGTLKTIRFSDYWRQWVVLLFYPADFTFV